MSKKIKIISNFGMLPTTRPERWLIRTLCPEIRSAPIAALRLHVLLAAVQFALCLAIATCCGVFDRETMASYAREHGLKLVEERHRAFVALLITCLFAAVIFAVAADVCVDQPLRHKAQRHARPTGFTRRQRVPNELCALLFNALARAVVTPC